MALGAQCGIFGPASGIVLHGSARPMVDGVAQPDVRRLAHQHDLAFSRSLRDRRDAVRDNFCAAERPELLRPAWRGQFFRRPARIAGSSRRAALLSAPSHRPLHPRAVRSDDRSCYWPVDECDAASDSFEVAGCGAHCSAGDANGRCLEPLQDLNKKAPRKGKPPLGRSGADGDNSGSWGGGAQTPTTPCFSCVNHCRRSSG